MKSFFVAFIWLLTGGVVFAQNDFTLTGTITGLNTPAKVILSYPTLQDTMTMTETVKDGAFVFKGKVKVAVFATLKLVLDDLGAVNMQKGDFNYARSFYLEEGANTVQINGTQIERAVLSEGPTNKGFKELRKMQEPYVQKIMLLDRKKMMLLKEGKKDSADALKTEITAIELELEKSNESFILAHPDYYASLNLVSVKALKGDMAVVEPLYNALSKRVLESDKGIRLTQDIESARATGIGRKAAEFSLPDTKGNLFTLSSTRGKYVLIDFWASWCAPCRIQNRYLVAAYSKWKNKNLEIISVSFDENRESWLKAIEKDGLSWPQISDLKPQQYSVVAQQYGITSMPQNVLLDPNGIVRARNLKDEEIEKKLAQLIRN